MTCQREDGYGPCDQQAEVQVTVGCEHEHVRAVHICRRCLGIVRTYAQRCKPCHEADGHRCELTLLEVAA